MEADANYKSELVGVFGHPVAENPTIVMIEAAFKELGLNWRYLNIEVLPENLETAVAGLRSMQFKGINLTIPHKVKVLPYLDRLAPDAALMGAVNTVRREGDILIGENTDGKGFLRSLLEDAELDPSGKRVVFLGAGGAARAMAIELALAGAESILIINRSEDKGVSLSRLIEENTSCKSDYLPWTPGVSFPADTDVLVNATSIGLFPNVTDKADINYDCISREMIVCDVIPNPPQTPFLSEASDRGARTLDGLGMLVYQGAIGFRMWTGQEPSVEVMRNALERVFR
jgi:shikimate dehydrogenase